ncbi:MAG: LeuD/DmdB family oxidoreductase small subunit [Promethearchaeota archaeon]
MTYEINPKNIWFFGNNINTDLIVPSKYLTENDPKVIVKHAFESVIKDFSSKVSFGDIIVAGHNFGAGSSREEAVFVIKELKIAAIIAESFARIYFRNLINQGIPAITIKNAPNLFKNLKKVKIYLEKGIISAINKDYENYIEIKFNPLPPFLMKIIKSGGMINLLKKQIANQK